MYTKKMAATRKRDRKANFTHDEIRTLLQGVAEYKDILQYRGPGAGISREKHEAWRLIAAAVNARSTSAIRSVEEIKKKWKDLRSIYAKIETQGIEASNKEYPFKELIDSIVGSSHESSSPPVSRNESVSDYDWQPVPMEEMNFTPNLPRERKINAAELIEKSTEILNAMLNNGTEFGSGTNGLSKSHHGSSGGQNYRFKRPRLDDGEFGYENGVNSEEGDSIKEENCEAQYTSLGEISVVHNQGLDESEEGDDEDDEFCSQTNNHTTDLKPNLATLHRDQILLPDPPVLPLARFKCRCPWRNASGSSVKDETLERWVESEIERNEVQIEVGRVKKEYLELLKQKTTLEIERLRSNNGNTSHTKSSNQSCSSLVNYVESSALNQHDRIQVSIQCASRSKLTLPYDKDEPIARLLHTYLRQENLSQSDVVFRFKEEELNALATPTSLNMDSDDCIEVSIKQNSDTIG